MTKRKTVFRLLLGLACSAAILWLGVGCGKDIDPDYPCDQEALLYANHVREVFKENRGLFRRQPGFRRAMEHFYRDEEGNWSDKYGIVIRVKRIKVDHETLPPEDRISDEIEGVPIYFDEGTYNYVGGLIEGIYECKAEIQYAFAVRWKHEDLLLRQPNRSSVIGVGTLGPEEPLSVDIGFSVTKKVRQSLLPPVDRIPDCLDGIPVRIYESRPDSE